MKKLAKYATIGALLVAPFVFGCNQGDKERINESETSTLEKTPEPKEQDNSQLELTIDSLQYHKDYIALTKKLLNSYSGPLDITFKASAPDDNNNYDITFFLRGEREDKTKYEFELRSLDWEKTGWKVSLRHQLESAKIKKPKSDMTLSNGFSNTVFIDGCRYNDWDNQTVYDQAEKIIYEEFDKAKEHIRTESSQLYKLIFETKIKPQYIKIQKETLAKHIKIQKENMECQKEILAKHN